MLNLFETIKESPAYFKQLGCKVLLCTRYDCIKEKDLQDLYSLHNFIIYVLNGKRTLLQSGSMFEMSEGKSVFSKKGAWLSQKNTEEWRALIFFLPDNYLQQFFKKYSSQFPITTRQEKSIPQMIPLEINDCTKGFFNSILPYFSNTPVPPETLIELKFREMLFNILLNPQNDELNFYLSTLANHYKQSLSEIMEANYTYNFALSEFAKLANLSLASFKREFKKVFQTTPGKWLMEKRLHYAYRLLNTTSKTINDIAFESGFENTTHFSRVFKARFQISPLHQRQHTVVH
jgi:AraC-like DNA-binding protein